MGLGRSRVVAACVKAMDLGRISNSFRSKEFCVSDQDYRHKMGHIGDELLEEHLPEEDLLEEVDLEEVVPEEVLREEVLFEVVVLEEVALEKKDVLHHRAV